MDFRRLRTDLLALGLLAMTVFAALSLCSFDPADPPSASVYPPRTDIGNLLGTRGAIAADALRSAFGYGAYFLLLAMISLNLRLFSRREEDSIPVRLIGSFVALVSVCVGLQLFGPTMENAPLVGNGGHVGAWTSILMRKQFSQTGVMILVLAMFWAGTLLSGEAILLRALIWLVLSPLKLVHWLSFGRPTRKESASPFRTESSKSSFTANVPTPKTEPDVLRFPVRTAGIVPGSNVDNASPEDEETGVTVGKGPRLQVVAADDEESNPSVAIPGETAASRTEDACGEEDGAGIDEATAARLASIPVVAPAPFRSIKVNPPAGGKSPRDSGSKTSSLASNAPRQDFRLPGTDLLEHPEEFPYDLLAKKAQIAAATLEKTFQEFGLNVKVVEIDTGPVITQFELELEAGLRLSKVTALADDLAIALRVPAVRVVAPIPGKNTVGVEVPNEKQVMVRLRELMESCVNDTAKKRIPIFLGKDVSGRPVTVDLAKMPHLLIAGRTGTGKSVCLNSLILSILMTRSPDQVKMLMIDPKMVELSPYRRVPHLMHPVITDMKKAEAVLAWAVDKMEERYDLLARCGVRHLDNYNQLGKDEILERLEVPADSPEAEDIPESMPFIVIIADEMADMMMTSGKDVEGHIIRLAQKSRAVGIHLVLATQKPTVDVITGLIKSNLPARIAFQVASRTDSRVVLDEMGADRLLGNGDMLYLAPGTSNLIRAQGTYVGDDEINSVIDFYKAYEPEYSTELAQLSSTGGGKKGSMDSIRARDEMYEQAIEVVIREGRGSVSLLQRALGIGYGRGARLIDYMAEDGIVGDYNGSQAREVLYTMEQWDELKTGETRELARS